MNVESKEKIDCVAEAIPTLDILINSAGLALFALGLDEYDPDVFDRAINMHLSNIYRLAARCAPKLGKSQLPGGASIISMASNGSILLIVADTDPGCGGIWIDPYGHTHGGWSFRLIKTYGKPPPPVFVWKVKLAELKSDGLAVIESRQPIISGGVVAQ